MTAKNICIYWNQHKRDKSDEQISEAINEGIFSEFTQ